MILDSKSNVHRSLDFMKLLMDKAREIVIESYTMYAIWKDLHDVLEDLETSSQDKSDTYFKLLMSKFTCRTQKASKLLVKVIAGYSRSAPNMRKFYLRKDSPLGIYSVPSDKYPEDMARLQLLWSFRSFEDPQTAREVDRLHNLLDHMATILRTSKPAGDLMSHRLSELVAQMSVIGECIMQQSLWDDTPQGHGAEHTCERSHNTEFYVWLYRLDDCNIPVNLLRAFLGKLSYPIHKTRNRSNVTVMRVAEASLDQFWECVDTYYEKTTGVTQYDMIERCLNEGQQMRRTPPWEDSDQMNRNRHVKAEYIYQPFSRMYHDRSMQITGGFDRLSMEEKIKPNTKGTATTLPTVHDAAIADKGRDPIHFVLDRRAYKTMKAMFHTPASDSEELPKSIKWNGFKRAMVRIGFSAEKLQGSAWQFTPSGLIDVDRAISFHEPHPDNDIPYIMARQFGRRLGRVYGWRGDTFRLA